MSGTPRETSQPHTVFVRSCAKPSAWLLRVRRRGRGTGDAHAVTCFLVFLSVSSTSFAAISLKSSPSPTVGGGPGTGGHDSETPSNRPLERPGMTASRPTGAASAVRSAPIR
jgi:hypothetical protein